MAQAGSAAATPTSASNALFLITFGMFLTAAVIPALMAALVRSVVLIALLLVAAISMNPTDHSFACWVSEQEDIDLRLKKEKPGVKQWFSAVVKTAIAMVTQEPLTWTYYNVLAFSVVFVPSLNRYAFGAFGNWWWADKVPRLLPICKAPWVVRFTRGGEPSGIDRYMEEDTPEARRRMSGNRSTRRPLSPGRSGTSTSRTSEGGSTPPRSNEFESAATALASSLGDLAESLQSTWSSGNEERRSGSSTATGSSDRALRASAMKAKINKDWRDAAKLFKEASRVALSLLSRTNYQLEAAWCEVEDATTFPDRSSRLAKLVDDICEELGSAGYFDDAARALSEFAMRLKRKFPDRAAQEEVARQLGDLYLRAQRLAEAGNSTRSALEHAKKAATVFADAALWQLAEECFEAAGKMQLKEHHAAFANDSFGNAVLCRIGQADVPGADQLAQVYRRTQLTSLGGTTTSDIDELINGMFDAYDKWSIAVLENAIARYQSRHPLQPWQLKCLANIHQTIASSDLR